MPPAARLTISRADVADFLLDELEHPAHVRRIIGLASVKAAARRPAACGPPTAAPGPVAR
jgi:hypothetical protein